MFRPFFFFFSSPHTHLLLSESLALSLADLVDRHFITPPPPLSMTTRSARRAATLAESPSLSEQATCTAAAHAQPAETADHPQVAAASTGRLVGETHASEDDEEEAEEEEAGDDDDAVEQDLNFCASPCWNVASYAYASAPSTRPWQPRSTSNATGLQNRFILSTKDGQSVSNFSL
jgi:hypothetical protein